MSEVATIAITGQSGGSFSYRRGRRGWSIVNQSSMSITSTNVSYSASRLVSLSYVIKLHRPPRGRLDTQGRQNAMHSNERFVLTTAPFASRQLKTSACWRLTSSTPGPDTFNRTAGRGERESQCRLGAETGGVREDPMGSGGDLTLT